MKKYIMVSIIFLCILLSTKVVFADSKTKIDLSDNQITVNCEKITNDTNSSIYLSNKMNNGGTSSKSIESNIEVENIININDAGDYEFTGKLADGQISINSNEINGNVNIILNNAEITCKNAPAIFVYSKTVDNDKCKVTITLKENSLNTITGGKIKTSVENFEDQASIAYYIDKGYDDDRQYYERYKYDGAISSDISLVFDGKGMLNVNSTKKEGIESKMDLTFNDGIYNINSLDDGINACADNKSVITINGGTIIVNVSSEAEEGDGIDSNGSIYVNGGNIYSFACPGSDNGLDADKGIYINGGTVLSTGDMAEQVQSSNGTNIIQMNFSKEIEAGETILIVDENEKEIFAYKTDRKMSTFVYSSEELEDKNYLIYTGTDIEGNLDENNIYTEITAFDLSKMVKQENSEMKMRPGGPMDNNRENFYMPPNNDIQIRVTTKVLIILVVLLIITVAIYVYSLRKNNKK